MNSLKFRLQWEQTKGVGLVHSTIKDGRRHSAANAFLKPVLQ